MTAQPAPWSCLPAALIAAGLLLGAPVPADAALPASGKAPVTIEVRGDDFPVLVHATNAPPPLDDSGLPRAPGCEAVRARRVDELPYPWRDAVERIRFDCEPIGEPDEGVSVDTSALLLPGRVWLAGHPVAEVRLMNGPGFGDQQYIVSGDYATVGADLRTLVEAACEQRHLRQELLPPGSCQMQATPQQFYLETTPMGGIWIHADPDDPGRTVYSEAWAD